VPKLLASTALAAATVLAFAWPSLAQDAPTAPADPLAQQVGAEMDRRDTDTPATSTAPARALRTTVGADKLLQTVAALCVVVALILIGSYALRRWGKRVPLLAGAHLGKVLGRLYLDRGTALHFVQVGEKVLLIGANANSISLISEYAAGAIHGRAKASGTEISAAAPFNPDSFLAELRARSQDLAGGERLPRAEEDEIANLRGDIQRLQRYLREENREQED
jgi:flagellar biogenesis protein FliO